MKLKSDGDIVRGLGFVVLYAAYMEEAIDECLELFKQKDTTHPKSIDKQPISKKIEYIENRLLVLCDLPHELSGLPDLMNHCKGLLVHRNEVIHGRIYGTKQTENDELRPSRKDGTKREVNAQELYDLAQQLIDTVSPLNHAHGYSLRRFLKISA
jgi:hypothetical protein